MFARAKRTPLLALLVVGGLLVASIAAACGGDDDSGPVETSVGPTTQGGGGEETDSGGGEGDEARGGAGTATVTVSAGTFELQLEEACLISDVGIGAVASSDEGSMTIAGPREISVIGFELASGDAWFAAAAEVVIDGTTMSYTGPALDSNEADSSISVEVFCDEVIDLGG